ncbi:MAG TPA: hypothetical protein VEU55_09160 [Gemmatimonadales bacterium]|nr:hypothetical protein [Gemmatimonadales bacterium]
MTHQRLTPEQAHHVEEIQEFLRTTEHVKRLVTELEANRAAATRVIQELCAKIAHETSQMRQRALTANIGTIADVAGAMSVMAGRGGGIAMKIRGLTDGVNSLEMQLDAALKHAMTPKPPRAPS